MKKLFLFLMILALTTCTLHARENSLEKGKKALQFGVNSNFTLGSFQGSAISIKKHNSDGSAWRFGMSLYLDFGGIGHSRWTEDSLIVDDNGDDNSQKIGLDLQKIFYPNREAEVNIYYGLGPTLVFENSKRQSYAYSSMDIRTKTDKAWRVGGRVLVGAEWFATKNISLMAEYSSSLLYRYRKTTQETRYDNGSVDGTEYSSDALQFASSYVRFGLSAYF